jgi:hypothetical protein
MRPLAVVVLIACGPDLSGIPDAGTPCSCEHVGSYWWETFEDGTTERLRVCVDNTPVNTCGETNPDAGCSGVVVLFGSGRCTWQ